MKARGLVEWVKRNALIWFEHIERMGSEHFVRKVYVTESVGLDSRGKSPGRLRDRVKECMCARGATRRERLDQARRESLNRELWRSFYHGHLLEERSRRERGSKALDR